MKEHPVAQRLFFSRHKDLGKGKNQCFAANIRKSRKPEAMGILSPKHFLLLYLRNAWGWFSVPIRHEIKSDALRASTFWKGQPVAQRRQLPGVKVEAQTQISVEHKIPPKWYMSKIKARFGESWKDSLPVLCSKDSLPVFTQIWESRRINFPVNFSWIPKSK